MRRFIVLLMVFMVTLVFTGMSVGIAVAQDTCNSLIAFTSDREGNTNHV